MTVVSNTSPITNLAAIGNLEILQALYGRILIPKAVFDELASDPSNPGLYEVQHCDWIELVPVTDPLRVQILLLELHRGEAEAIALAVERNADVVLLDESIARDVAKRLGLQRSGVLGILLEAKRQGFLPTIRYVVDQLISNGFWINQPVYRYVLEQANEL